MNQSCLFIIAIISNQTSISLLHCCLNMQSNLKQSQRSRCWKTILFLQLFIFLKLYFFLFKHPTLFISHRKPLKTIVLNNTSVEKNVFYFSRYFSLKLKKLQSEFCTTTTTTTAQLTLFNCCYFAVNINGGFFLLFNYLELLN